MTRLTAKDFHPDLLELYDYYAHGRISRREFLDRAARYAVGGLTAAAILSSMSPDCALAQQVEFTDPEIVPEYITHPSPEGHGAVRGFCYGGGVSNTTAVAYPDLAAAVPFCGRQPKAEDVPRIKAPLLLHYGELDKGVNEGWPACEAALKANGKTCEAYIYPGANHGFHNDSTPRYDEAAAKLAWDRTIAWFRRHLERRASFMTRQGRSNALHLLHNFTPKPIPVQGIMH